MGTLARWRRSAALAVSLGAPTACAVTVQQELHLGANQIEQQRAASLGVNLGYVTMGREPGEAENAALNVAAAVVFAKFSRDDERAADHAAVRYTTHGRRDAPVFHDLQRAVRALPPPPSARADR